MCHIWNDFADSVTKGIICLLNNDIRIPKIFNYNLQEIFKDKNTGIVIHPTNSLHYNKSKEYEGNIKILPVHKYRQGWDICISKEVWVKIPESIHWFFGDDYLFKHVYDINKNVVVDLDCPIIHYCSQTKRPTSRLSNDDQREYKKFTNNKITYDIPRPFSNIIPPREFKII